MLSGDRGRRSSDPFPAATMDGYAVVADDPSPWREIIGRSRRVTSRTSRVSLGKTAAWIWRPECWCHPEPQRLVPGRGDAELADEHDPSDQKKCVASASIPIRWLDLAQGSVVLQCWQVSAPRKWASGQL